MGLMKPNDAFFYISCNAETECFLFPVPPEKVTYTDSIKNTSITVSSLGETTVIEKSGADTVAFNSRFPAVWDQQVVVDTLYPPSYYRNMLEKWRGLGKPVHFVCTCALNINDYFTIEELTFQEVGGPVGELSFTFKLKVYKEPKIRKIDLTPKGAKVSNEKNRVDNSVAPTTYKVVKGDSLWKIAKKFYGDGSKWKDIFELNKNIVKNANSIKPGQVLKLPAKKS